MVTPPVAVAAYAAAEIAEEDMLKIGWKAVKLCFIAFLIPFMFIHEPGLLMEGPWSTIISEFIFALIGVIALGASFQGWLFCPLNPWGRIAFFLAAILMIIPGMMTNIAGFIIFSGVGAFFYMHKNRKLSTGTEASI